MNPRPTRWQDLQTLLAVVCIGLGLLLLLKNLRIITLALDLVVAAALMAMGLLMFVYYLRDRQQWWALFPAFALPALGLVIGLDALLPRLDLSGPIFLGGTGISFLAVYYVRREHWWPLIPAGVLLTLATMDTLKLLVPRLSVDWLFFMGLALTFGAVYAVSPNRQQAGWALIVAVVSGVIGLVTMSGAVLKYLFPLLLIAVGVYELVRSQRQN
ncbi:MAG TPA: hypothetical protein VIL07_12245 [Symbiobacteriaceae bacterium]